MPTPRWIAGLSGLALLTVVSLAAAPRGVGSQAAGDRPKEPRFAHASLAAYPNAVISIRDPESGMTFYVESDGRRLVALDRDGVIAWGLDLFDEARFTPYLGAPVIRHLRVEGGWLWATCGKKDFARIDIRDGRAEHAGRD
jgi:hypothetical protein